MFWDNNDESVDTKIIEIRESSTTEYIEAPPGKVWDCISDIRNYDKWVTWYKVSPPEDLEKIEKPGDTVDYETTILGIPFKGKVVTVERIPPQRSAFFLLSAYRGGGEFLLEPLATGTRVHYTIWSELPSSYLGKVVEKTLLAHKVKENMQDHLSRMKAYIEGTTVSK